jgi:hypothetical protein
MSLIEVGRAILKASCRLQKSDDCIIVNDSANNKSGLSER